MSYQSGDAMLHEDNPKPEPKPLDDLATDAAAMAASLLEVITFLRLHFPAFEGLPADPTADKPSQAPA
jgi:hypothetical protein